MKSDSEIREDVINELRWDPQITEPDAIGVAVQDGAVTLTGHVSTYAQRLAASRAAERVYGVKAVANELTVKLSGAPRDDSDIARAIAHVLEWNVQVPEGKVHARVSGGWVTLEGEVSDHTAELYGHVHSLHEAAAARAAAAAAPGVATVESHLLVSP